MAKKIVTNLRIDDDDWRQIKVQASELDMSANEYLIYLIKNFSLKRELGFKGNLVKEEAPIWKLPELARMPNKPTPFKKDDDDIYG